MSLFRMIVISVSLPRIHAFSIVIGLFVIASIQLYSGDRDALFIVRMAIPDIIPTAAIARRTIKTVVTTLDNAFLFIISFMFKLDKVYKLDFAN